jgi:hypothetical protein
MACLRDVRSQQLVFAPVTRSAGSELHMVISSLECASTDLASNGVGKLTVSAKMIQRA